VSRSSLQWYANRLAGMSPVEVAWRAGNEVRQAGWSRRQVRPGQRVPASGTASVSRRFTAVLPPGAAQAVPAHARAAVVAAADDLLAGRWEVLGVTRTDLASPDWFLDPVTGRRAPSDRYAFRINHRSETETGNVKQVWELSRHQHLTVLAAAYFLTGRGAYAERVADQLRSWWRDNPFLSGIHWTSGIELGLRLISWTWIRRLLDAWPAVTELFDDNEIAVRQIYWHQQYLAAFRSRGSSANNHVIAEAAGLLVASCAFPWYPASTRWRRNAAAMLESELEANTFPSGVNRELASDYHAFVVELGLLAAVEAAAAGHALSDATGARLCRMVDAAAAIVDEQVRPPRQGDGDEGRGLVLQPSRPDDWRPVLSLGAAVFGPISWWPTTSADARSTLVSALARPPAAPDPRPQQRPSHFADAGITLLRTPVADGPEIWCRCDGGPHGYLSIAGHAHADALSVELRYGGVDVLVDPGTYCYHGDPEWRAYFRSTLAHNTVELAGRSQSLDAGPFIWRNHARCAVLDVDVENPAEEVHWAAQHDGYLSLEPPARHLRGVRLDNANRSLEITDRIEGGAGHPLRMTFHLGPHVRVDLRGAEARLRFEVDGAATTAVMRLPEELHWNVHRGEVDPVLGWVSPRFGRRVPASTLCGAGSAVPGRPLVTRISFPATATPGRP